MSFFRDKLKTLQPDPKNRRWLFIPYDQLSDSMCPLSNEDPKSMGIVLFNPDCAVAAYVKKGAKHDSCIDFPDFCDPANNDGAHPPRHRQGDRQTDGTKMREMILPETQFHTDDFAERP